MSTRRDAYQHSNSVTGVTGGHHSSVQDGTTEQVQSGPVPILRHRRSASHGGVSWARDVIPCAPTPAPPRGHNLDVPGGRDTKHGRPGHTRAFSQGQIPHAVHPHSHGGGLSHSEVSRQGSRTLSLEGLGFRKGHSRQASRTESVYTLRRTRPPLWHRLRFWQSNKVPDLPRSRLVVPNHVVPSGTPWSLHPNRAYTSNFVSTTKYTFLSFLPKNLLEQFHRFANLYFLFIVLLNWAPAINAFGKEVAMIPVLFVLGVTAVKDLFEDRRRRLSDNRVNKSTCMVYNATEGRYLPRFWRHIRVGDIVHLGCNQTIPADILMLRSSDEHGVAYIETSNLDGETNLKQRTVPRDFVADTDWPRSFTVTVEVDPPTTKLYQFHGALLMPDNNRVLLGRDNLLLRDCVLKNTNFIEGIVVYAGHETKALLNHGGPRYKRSTLEKCMNLDVVWCVVALVLLCLAGACGSGLWLHSILGLAAAASNGSQTNISIPFLSRMMTTTTGEEDGIFYQAFLAFWTFVIILQVLIPLSLYVTLELTKLAQVYHISQDPELYDAATGKTIECRALNITEELGQIQYVFSDKTGTLTENQMIFRRCTVGGVDYNHPTHPSNVEEGKGAAKPRQKVVPNARLEDDLRQFEMQIPAYQSQRPEGFSLQLVPQAKKLQEFLVLLAVCNTVVVAKQPHHDQMNAGGQVIPPSLPAEDDASDRDSALSLDSVAPSLNSTTLLVTPPPQSAGNGRPRRPRSIFSLPPRRRTSSTQPPGSGSTHTGRAFSPIQSVSSTGSSPSQSPLSMLRPRFLQLPSYFSRRSSGSQLSGQSPSVNVFTSLFEAESPDELALVDAAAAYGCRLVKRTPHHVCVEVPGEGLIQFVVLCILPFDSTRKRMSVLLKHPSTGQLIFYCKGADSAIFTRLARTSSFSEQQLILKTQQQVNTYAKQGLRVLVMSKRVLSEAEYTGWMIKYTAAQTSAEHMRERALQECYAYLEKDLTLLGATGIEDKLQDGVPSTLRALRGAGIQVWVLTGDKQETALNIAYAAALFAQDMEIVKLNARNKDTAEAAINTYLETFDKQERDIEGWPIDQQIDVRVASCLSVKKALVVDGKTLLYILDKRSGLQWPFLKLTRHCGAVLCCRATPLQKAFIVKIVKQQLGMRTLAIGDGANDVSMIQTADVGIGISGQEGLAAVMAADYAIPRFRFLERLLLVHGHWCYDRLARMVLFFFYKNATFVLVVFWYQIFCGFSGTVQTDQLYLMFFNLLFSSLPPLAMGIYDQDAPDHVLIANPGLYAQGREGRLYRPHSFWVTFADGFYQSLVLFFVAWAAYYDTTVGIWEFGTLIFTGVIGVVLVEAAFEFKSWTILHVLALLGSFMLYISFALIYNASCVRCPGLPNPYWVMQTALSTRNFWLTVMLSVVLAVLPRMILKAVVGTLNPSSVTRTLLKVKRETQLRPRPPKNSSDDRASYLVAWSRVMSASFVMRSNESES